MHSLILTLLPLRNVFSFQNILYMRMLDYCITLTNIHVSHREADGLYD
jgi:hypothetical protein